MKFHMVITESMHVMKLKESMHVMKLSASSVNIMRWLHPMDSWMHAVVSKYNACFHEKLNF